jgi:hypothetical protein
MTSFFPEKALIGVAALISAPSRNGKRPGEPRQVVRLPASSRNYSKFTNMNPI